MCFFFCSYTEEPCGRFASWWMDGWLDGCTNIPLAIPSSPAVSSARVASLGKFSSTTEAAIVMGRAASWSGSASGGAEEGEGEGEGDGDGEGMMFVVAFFFLLMLESGDVVFAEFRCLYSDV